MRPTPSSFRLATKALDSVFEELVGCPIMPVWECIGWRAALLLLLALCLGFVLGAASGMDATPCDVSDHDQALNLWRCDGRIKSTRQIHFILEVNHVEDGITPILPAEVGKISTENRSSFLYVETKSPGLHFSYST